MTRCRICGKQLRKAEVEHGRCNDTGACWGRQAKTAMKGMATRPGLVVPDVDAAYAAAPKMGDR